MKARWWDREFHAGRDGRRFDVSATFCLWPVNRPYVMATWSDDDECWISFDYGNRNSDPVFSVTFTVRRPPRWLSHVIGWLDR